MKPARSFFGVSVCAFVLWSCAHAPAPLTAYQDPAQDKITIAVVGMNDFHGHLLPRERKLNNGTVVKSGGASALASIIKILNQEMQGRVLIVDGGDEWQGTLESNFAKGATVTDFLGRLGVKVAAIGNHEFDFTLENLRERAKKAKYNFLASNIYEKKTHKPVKWERVLPSKIVEVEGIKFGVIGVSTVQTPGTTRHEYVKHLDFVDPVEPVKAQSAQLKAEGANAVLVTAHAGTYCKDGSGERGALKSWAVRTISEVQGECDERVEIFQLAKKVGPQVLDGIVAGHTHQVHHHWMGGLPVVQGEAYNQYFNIIYYTFDRASKKLLPELTRIEGLVPICTEYFEGTKHCDDRMLRAGESPRLVPALFHGQAVIPDAETEAWLAPIRQETEKFQKQAVGATELPLTHARNKEAALQNLVADVVRARAGTDFAVINSGGVRAAIDAGPINMDNLFRALPFDNLLNVLTLTGAEIKTFIQIASTGNHGLVGVSGLKTVYSAFTRTPHSEDLNHDGRIEGWEESHLLSVTRTDGTALDDKKLYTVATFDYLVNGGDDLSWFMSQIPEKRINRGFHEICRDLVREFLLKKKVINTRAHPLVDPARPRIVIEE